MAYDIQIGDNPVLRKKSRPISRGELGNKNFQSFLDELEDIMLKADGLGLAAVQIDVHKNVIAVKINNRTTCLINPLITARSNEMAVDDEGCLSFPGLFGKVRRHKTIEVTAQDRAGKKIVYNLANLDARVVQHECDHLQGVLLPDRLAQTARLLKDKNKKEGTTDLKIN